MKISREIKIKIKSFLSSKGVNVDENTAGRVFKVANCPSHPHYELCCKLLWDYLVNAGSHLITETDLIIPINPIDLPSDFYLPKTITHSIEKENEIEIQIKSLKGVKETYHPDWFKPIKSGSPLDILLSSEGGIMRGRIFMTIGEPGTGKSTVLMQYLVNLKELNPQLKVLYISSEMDELDLIPYSDRISGFDSIPIFYIGDYLDTNPLTALERALEQGWDIVVIDSFSDLKDKLSEVLDKRGKALETAIINLLIKHKKGADVINGVTVKYNQLGVPTTFICINHSTKGGDYEGSTKIKHNTSGMMELRRDGDNKTFISFSKNRVGFVDCKLYYVLSNNGVIYDERKLLLTLNLLKNEESLDSKFEMDMNSKFDSFLLNLKNELETKKINNKVQNEDNLVEEPLLS
jgi:hypothetical protein